MSIKITRRKFLGSTATALLLSPMISMGKGKPADLNVALLGVGEQGQRLMQASLKIPGLRFKAVCDIWEYNLRRASNTLKPYGHDNNAYIDYEEMLSKEKDLDAIVIATPDFWHARQTIDSLESGLHVFTVI